MFKYLPKLNDYILDRRLLYKWTVHGKYPSITPDHRSKLKYIGIFSYANLVNSSNFIATTLIFSEKFDQRYLHVFIFRNMFPESQGFVAVPVTS